MTLVNIAAVVAVNSDRILAENLLRSAEFAGGMNLIEERGHSSAGAAYNSGLARCAEASVVVCIHQDVYLPTGWGAKVTASLIKLDPSWAVAGVWGVKRDGVFCGRVWCSGGGRQHVGLAGTHEVASLDEIVLLVNMRHGLRFDPSLPGYHLYATDLILQAKQRGLGSYCIEAPVVHNSRCNPQPLDRHYWAAYRYMQRKWAEQLPLRTCVVDVTRWGWPLYRQWAKNELRMRTGRVRARPPYSDPRPIAARLGYDQRQRILNG